MPTPRRDFLGWLGGSALYASMGMPLPSPTPALTGMVPIATDWDMSWTDRVKGSHRAVFDSPEISEGAALWRAITWRKQYKTVYGTDPSDMTPVLVLRHLGIDLIMDDAHWAEFELGKANKLRDENGKKWTKVNPIGSLQPGTPPQFADINLPAFMQAGGIVLACNLAFGEVVSRVAEKAKATTPEARAEARKQALAHVIPGVILQPSGFFAVLRAQEAGCHFMMAS